MTVLILMTLLGAAVAGPVLRYKMDSCNSLEPVYVTESWAVYPGTGGYRGVHGAHGDSAADGGLFFESPRRSSDRSPPFSIHIDFKQYRRNREYTGRYESFKRRFAKISQSQKSPVLGPSLS